MLPGGSSALCRALKCSRLNEGPNTISPVPTKNSILSLPKNGSSTRYPRYHEFLSATPGAYNDINGCTVNAPQCTLFNADEKADQVPVILQGYIDNATIIFDNPLPQSPGSGTWYQFGSGTILGLNVDTDNQSYGQGYTLVFYSPSPVPIPAAAWLFGSALCGLVAVARRKRH